jgi:hypothetical protein
MLPAKSDMRIQVAKLSTTGPVTLSAITNTSRQGVYSSHPRSTSSIHDGPPETEPWT